MHGQEEANRYKIILMMVILIIVWGICSKVQQKFDGRFQEDLIDRMGRRRINSTKRQLIQKNQQKNMNEEKLQELQSQLDSMLAQTYNLDSKSKQQQICVIVRDFDTTQEEADYLTFRSILSQNYTNFNIVHIRDKNSSPAPKIKTYFQNKKISFNRYFLVIAKHDTIEALFNASVKCLQSSIMILLQNKEIFVSPMVLQVINANFKPNTDLAWATSLYQNDRLGFSFDYNDQVKKNNNFRKYPLAMNDVIAYRNSLLSKCRTYLNQFHLNYPLNVSESFGWTFLQNAQQTKYIPEILSFKPKNGIYRSQRSSFDRQLQQLIRQNKSVRQFSDNLLNAK